MQATGILTGSGHFQALEADIALFNFSPACYLRRLVRTLMSKSPWMGISKLAVTRVRVIALVMTQARLPGEKVPDFQ